ncbi:F-box protein CPR1-like [Corylus avellana]|uniref:F-box protein CPR1-like n=1 Tax=Corylus avellana TaxID=13451 RepID=UPI00286A0125|nr:F-box protein CPR1-like [Corylus avellana]XP_059439529.1 F-box protein CPR1-like [Corylus avellana]XP_059439530.1 F-box protein CPR1-like [Corylus avellana]
MADLPSEILIAVLCRLPVRSLLRFRSVSKPFRSLIDSTGFIDLHLKNSIETGSNLSLMLRRDSEIYLINLDALSDAVLLAHPLMCYSNRILILGSTNGLICISNVAEDIALWNPSIRRHKVLPFLPIERIGSSLLGTRVFGFGYDPVSEDYKLVRISQFINLDNEGFVSKVKVYSLRANEWRDSEDMPYVLCYARKNGTFASGALHWVVNRKFNVEEADLIVAFDLTVERFREVPLPECEEKRFHIEVGVLGRCVCMIATYPDVRIDVWVMREYGVKESWAKLFSVAKADVVGSYKYLRPLAYSKTGREVLVELDNQRLVWYDLRGKRVENVSVGGLPDSFEAEIFVGSLVPTAASRRDHGKKQSLEEEKNKKNRDDFLSEGFKLVL